MKKEIAEEILRKEAELDLDVFFWDGVGMLKKEEYIDIIKKGKLPSGRGVKNVDLDFYLEMVVRGGGSKFVAT